MIDVADVFLRKAQESLAGAESEAAAGRYNNCANRCYYACFQAAVAALVQSGIRPPGRNRQWSHAFVAAQFVGQLVNRRKIYPAGLRDTLARAFTQRQAADYEGTMIGRDDAGRLVRRAREFVGAVEGNAGGRA